MSVKKEIEDITKTIKSMIEYNTDYINWSEHEFTCAFYKFKRIYTVDEILESGINASSITRARRKYVNEQMRSLVNDTTRSIRSDREKEFKKTMTEEI